MVMIVRLLSSFQAGQAAKTNDVALAPPFDATAAADSGSMTIAHPAVHIVAVSPTPILVSLPLWTMLLLLIVLVVYIPHGEGRGVVLLLIPRDASGRGQGGRPVSTGPHAYEASSLSTSLTIGE